MELMHQLTPKLKQLRLSGVLETLDVRHRQAIDSQWTHVEFLARLLEDEVERRAQKQLALRTRRATVNTAKTLENYDFAFNPMVKRAQVLQLASCDYIRQKQNVLVCGPTGVGKSHLAQALGHEALRQGFDVLFVNAHKMLQHLHGGRADGSLVKPLTAPAPEDLYDVINERYERGSIMLTSNRAPAEWPDLFGNPLLASAGLDRLTHHAEMIVITGQSFRAQGRVRLEQEVLSA